MEAGPSGSGVASQEVLAKVLLFFLTVHLKYFLYSTTGTCGVVKVRRSGQFSGFRVTRIGGASVWLVLMWY